MALPHALFPKTRKVQQQSLSTWVMQGKTKMNIVAVDKTTIIDAIGRDELMLQAFAMDFPDATPGPNEFSNSQQLRAQDVLKYSNVIDQTLGIQVLDEEVTGPCVSRDVLVTYKTLVYKAVMTAEEWRNYADRYKYLSWALSATVLAVAVWSYAHFPVASFQQPQ